MYQIAEFTAWKSQSKSRILECLRSDSEVEIKVAPLSK
jgi:hypothetical protein